MATTESELLTSNWSASTRVSTNIIWNAVPGTIGSRTIMVHASTGYQLYWREMVGSVWTEPTKITGEFSRTRVSLAPYNGYLYMVATDYSTATKLRVSRFNPATNQWTASFVISHTSGGGPPALAVYAGKLHLIGVDSSSKQLWQATMSADEVFTPAVFLPGQYSNSRVSAAATKCKLFIAHRAGSTDTVVYNSFNGSWGPDLTIPAGPGGQPIRATEPVIAERAGFIHLLHKSPDDSTFAPVWWTYLSGGSWASEVTIPGASTFYPVTLTTGGPGLVAITTQYYDSVTASLRFSQAIPPFSLPCGIVQPPITGL